MLKGSRGSPDPGKRLENNSNSDFLTFTRSHSSEPLWNHHVDAVETGVLTEDTGPSQDLQAQFRAAAWSHTWLTIKDTHREAASSWAILRELAMEWR